jgi:hypothetical protein
MCTEKQLLDCLISSEVKEGKDGLPGLLFGGRLQPFDNNPTRVIRRREMLF